MALMTTAIRDESALVAAARAGDERAFGELVDPYRRALEVHCYRMLGSLDDAEDAAQETLLKAWRSLGRFEQRSSVQTWLYRIATNTCLDELDRRPRRAEIAVDPYPDARLEDAVSPIADPAARYAQREGIELAFLTSIQRLPGRQRVVLILRDVLGWSGAETAELLESSVSAVHSALQRARATIDLQLPARSVFPRRATESDLLKRYVDAWERADIGGLVALMRDDAMLLMPPQAAVVGAEEVVAFFARVRSTAHLAANAVGANGAPAVAIQKRGEDGVFRPYRLLLLDVEGEQVARLHAYGEPRLLEAFTWPRDRPYLPALATHRSC
jgi:RNA polymerase sigma-70 factor, ECF subfamily